MKDKKIFDGLAVFSANITKRWLEENLYEKIFDTEFGKNLKDLDGKTKYGIEVGLNALTAFFDQYIEKDNVIKKYVREVGVDAAPEISKRLINNTKEDIATEPITPEAKEILNVLLDLEHQTFVELLNWLYDKEPDEQREIYNKISNLSFDRLTTIAKISPEERNKFFELSKLLSSKNNMEGNSTKSKIIDEKKKKRINKWIKNLKKDISGAIKLLIESVSSGARSAGEKAKPYAKSYLKGLLILALIVILSPIPFFIIGLLFRLNWMFAVGGIWYALCAFLLLIAASPIGMLIESLTGGVKGSGTRYIKFASTFLLIGLCISLLFAIIPIHKNPTQIPILILASIILGLMNAWILSRKVIVTFTSLVFIILCLSFFFPSLFNTIGNSISSLDVSINKPKQITLTIDSIEKQEIELFDQNGKPKIWYYPTKEGKFEFYNKAGIHPIYNEKFKPLIKEDLTLIISYLKEEDKKRRTEKKQKEDRAIALERKKQEEEEKNKKQKAAQQRENFLNRYLSNRSFINKNESKEVAILLIDEVSTINHDMAQKIALNLENRAIKTTTSLFSARLIADGMFEKMFEGNSDEVRNLELSKFCDQIMLGKTDLEYEENPDMEDMISAKIKVTIHVISAKTGIIQQRITLSDVGAGFSKDAAKKMAIEKISNKAAEQEWDFEL